MRKLEFEAMLRATVTCQYWGRINYLAHGLEPPPALLADDDEDSDGNIVIFPTLLQLMLTLLHLKVEEEGEEGADACYHCKLDELFDSERMRWFQQRVEHVSDHE